MEAPEPARLNEWQRGAYDKRSRPWLVYLLTVLAAVMWIGVLQNIGGSGDGADLLVMIVWPLIITVFIASVAYTRFKRRTVMVEEVMYFDLHPSRVSGAIERLLRGEGVPHTREGPTGDGSEAWEDRFELLGSDYLGHSVTVEWDHVALRVGMSRVTVQSNHRRRGAVERLEGLVESAITAERLRDESGPGEPPELVLYAPP